MSYYNLGYTDYPLRTEIKLEKQAQMILMQNGKMGCKGLYRPTRGGFEV